MVTNNPNLILLAHSGKQHSYHVAKSLKDLGRLYEFHTSSYIRNKTTQDLLLKVGDKFFSKRFLEGLYGKEIKPNWRFEIPELVASKIGKSRRSIQMAVFNRDVKFDQYMSSILLRSKANLFWGFQGSCHNALRTAGQMGMPSICELATGHVVESIHLLSEERKMNPDWADSFDNLDFPKDYELRLREEPHIAKNILAASTFTKRTLVKDGVPLDKIKILPLGFELDHIDYKIPGESNVNGPLKLLYTGRITQRKGVSYLLEAMKRLKGVASLDMIGFVHGKGAGLRKYREHIHLRPPLHQYDLFKEYWKYDALVLPSIFEGFGLVIVEAMAAGLPVITTTHTIGGDIIKHQKNGYLVNIRDVDGIVAAVQDLAHRSYEDKMEMRLKARESALDLSWQNYTYKLQKLLKQLEA